MIIEYGILNSIPAHHLLGDSHFESGACELAMGVESVDAAGALEDLYDSPFATDFQYLSFSDTTISQTHVDYLCVFGQFHIVQDHQRSVHFHHCSVVHSRSDIVVSSCC